jgi:putative ABC transport system ATP-binding protein
MSEDMLRITNASKSFAGPEGSSVDAVREVSLELAPGEFMALGGPSGCGKSTILLIAGGLLRPDQGEVAILGNNLYQKNGAQRAAIRAKYVGFVFQQFHLVPYLGALDNVLAPSLAQPLPNAAQRAMGLLEQFGLSDRRGHLPSALSVGEQQRVALARALLAEPKLLLADEPTGNLDPENAEGILEHLSAFADEGGCVLMVTHDDRAARRATRSIRMEEGRIPKALS